MHISFAIQTGETAPALPGKYLWIFRRKKKIYKISNRRSKSCKSKVLKYTKLVVKSYSHYDSSPVPMYVKYKKTRIDNSNLEDVKEETTEKKDKE